MTARVLPAAGCVVDRPSRRRALIPRDCWAESIDAALIKVGGIAAGLLVLAFIAATEPLGAWLLNHSTFGAH